MTLPVQLPEALRYCEKIDSDTQLLDVLTKKTKDLLLFFECAAFDETWSELHPIFMHGALEWFTKHFLHNRISLEEAKIVEAIFWSHYYILSTYLPLDYSLQGEAGALPVNSLLLALSSEILRDLVRSHTDALRLEDVPDDFLKQVVEFALTRTVADLWKQDQEKIIKLLRIASHYEITGLKEHCETILKRYINRENAVEMLIQSYQESWGLLKESCFSFINALSIGVRIFSVEQRRVAVEEKEVQPLALEFLDFGESALDIFSKLKPYVTHLTCSGLLTDEPAFSLVVNECPRLIGLDISRSKKYSDRLMDIPSNLQEIDISKCLWLTDLNLNKMISYSRHIIRLSLGSNVQLTFQGWSELLKYHRLRALDISRCAQVNDEMFSLILKATNHLIELDMEDCKRVSEKGFFDIPQHLHSLAVLNVARTHITDAALIDIASRCTNLRVLYLTRCQSISPKGLLQTLRQATDLRELYVNGCNLSDEVLKKIGETYPNLKVVE